MSKSHRARLTVRTYQGERDIPAIAALYRAASKVDGPEFHVSDDEMRQILSEPVPIAGENAFLFEEGKKLVALGRIHLQQGAQESVFELHGMVRAIRLRLDMRQTFILISGRQISVFKNGIARQNLITRCFLDCQKCVMAIFTRMTNQVWESTLMSSWRQNTLARRSLKNGRKPVFQMVVLIVLNT